VNPWHASDLLRERERHIRQHGPSRLPALSFSPLGRGFLRIIAVEGDRGVAWLIAPELVLEASLQEGAGS
jgi:hypothetical protein